MRTRYKNYDNFKVILKFKNAVNRVRPILIVWHLRLPKMSTIDDIREDLSRTINGSVCYNPRQGNMLAPDFLS